MRETRPLMRLVDRAETGLKVVSRFMAAIAAIVLGIMMMLTVADVTGRYFFNHPINGSWELIGFLLVCGGTWGLAYCQVTKAHIRVTVLHDIFPARPKAVITFVAYLIRFTRFRRHILAIHTAYEKSIFSKAAMSPTHWKFHSILSQS